MAIVSTSAKPTTMTTQLSVVNAITDLHFALLIAFLILAVYWNSLQGAFIWDDRAAIIQNPDVRGFTKIGDILYHDFWGQDITLADSHKSFRPVTTITFRIDHIFYGLSAYGYHISNLLIYIASSLAMYCACKQWVDLSVARLAALIFVLHPIHVEAVASIVGRADCLGGFFYFSSMSLYTKATRTQCLWTSTLFAVLAMASALVAGFSKEIGITAFAVFVVIDILEHMRFAVLSSKTFKHLKSAQQAASQREIRGACVENPSLANGFEIIFRSIISFLCSIRSLFRFASISVILFLFFRFRYSLHGEHALYRWTVMENHIDPIPDFLPRFLSYGQSHFWYVFKLIYPRHLCFDYGFDCIPTIYSLQDIRNILPIIVYALVILLTVIAIRSCRQSMLLGLATFLISLLPALNIVMPVGTILAERLLFVPSMGFCILIAELLLIDGSWIWSSMDDWIFSDIKSHQICIEDCTVKGKQRSNGINRPQNENYRRDNAVKVSTVSSFYLFLLPLLAAYSIRIVTRNVDWKTEINMYSSALSVCPRSIKALSNYGMFATSRGNYEESIPILTKAVEIYPDHVAALLNLGVAYNKQDSFVQSIKNFEAVVPFPENTGFKSSGYLGSALYSFADKHSNQAPMISQAIRRQALQWFEHSIRERHFYPPAILHVAGSTAFDLGDFEHAIEYYQAALMQHDRLVEFRQGSSDVPLEDDIRVAYTLNQLANAYNELGKQQEALEAYLMGIKIEPESVALLANAGLLYRRLGQVDQAREMMRKAIVLSGDSPPPALINNLGSLELELKNYPQALHLFEQAWDLTLGRTDNNNEKLPGESKYRFDSFKSGGVEEVIIGNIYRTFEEQGMPVPLKYQIQK